MSIVVRSELTPRDAESIRAKIGNAPNVVVVASYVPESAQALFLEDGINYADELGNIRISISDPGLFIDATSAEPKPTSPRRGVSSLRGAKAGWIARTLIESKEPMSVSELAAKSGSNIGYTSRVLEFLDQQALVKRDRLGRPTSVAWIGLLHRWAADAPFETRGTLYRYLAPHGISAALGDLALRPEGTRYAVTGSHAAARFAPVSPARLLAVHTEDAAELAKEIGLRPATSGVNVILLDATDEMPFTGAVDEKRIWYAPPVVVAADLLTLPGRAPAEGEALLSWMKEHERDWR